MKITLFWFRRDLRLEDNIALAKACSSGLPVKLIFIFDDNIIKHLPPTDARINFIYNKLQTINAELKKHGTSIDIYKGKPIDIWRTIINEYDLASVYINKDYEPYALERDNKINTLLLSKGIALKQFKDQVVFEESEIVKKDGTPYLVYTPYKNKWLDNFDAVKLTEPKQLDYTCILKESYQFPSLAELGFRPSNIKVREFDINNLENYSINRDFPAEDSTSYLGPHLRFGTVSIRRIIAEIGRRNDKFLNELIWREFFKQILFHFPYVVNRNFNSKYDAVPWNNDENEFEFWFQGKTGYPMVDAGMRQLNATGYMHNRVRMITAGFLCKHLLIDWRLGEAYFASKLLDYDLSSNNGNWQWAAGTGCDAAPYFRIFNPIEQQKKFDKHMKYIKKWLPEFGTDAYPKPIVEHSFARNRAIETYKNALIERKKL